MQPLYRIVHNSKEDFQYALREEKRKWAHNEHTQLSFFEKKKWAHMQPIYSYFNIYRHILKSFLHKNKKMVLQTYNRLITSHKKLKLTLKEPIA